MTCYFTASMAAPTMKVVICITSHGCPSDAVSYSSSIVWSALEPKLAFKKQIIGFSDAAQESKTVEFVGPRCLKIPKSQRSTKKRNQTMFQGETYV